MTAAPRGRPRPQHRSLPRRGGGLLRQPRRDRLVRPGDRARLLSRASARPQPQLAERPPRRLPGPQAFPTRRSPPPIWPGPGSTASSRPGSGDATKIFLAKRSIRGSSYPAITSSFFVQSIFDTTVGVLVLIYAITQGLLPAGAEAPRAARLRHRLLGREPAAAAVRDHRRSAIGLVILFAVLARRAEEFWDRVKQGVVVLTEPRRYLREVASWQGVGWLLRFARLLLLPRGVPDRRLLLTT